MLILFGCGVNAQVATGGGSAGNYLSVNFGWGLGVIFGILVANSVSGAHLNPAVTLTMVLHKRLYWKKMFHYWAG
jgi:glycerol uptake facilitator protein